MKMLCLFAGFPHRKIWSLLLLALWLPGALHAQVVINEILVDNQKALPNGAGKYTTWIELYNPTAQAVNIAGWGLTDSMTSPGKYVFPAGTVVPTKGFLLVWCDDSTNATGLHTGWSLDSAADDVTLYKTSIQIIDRVAFGTQLPDISLGRYPDGDATLKPGTPSPLGANTALPLGTIGIGTVKINEWMASADGDDWFELYNTNALMIDLGGLFLANTTDLTGWANPSIPPYSFMAGHGFLKIVADEKKTNQPNHVNFKLPAPFGTITVVGANHSTLIDLVQFTNQTKNISEGRLPDGSDNRVLFTPAGKSTPGDSNFQTVTEVIFNEILAHTDVPLEDAIELFNPTAEPVNISYWWLSNSRDDPKKYRIPNGTIVPAGGFKVFYEYQFNPDRTGTGRSFTLNSAQGDQAYLYSAASDASGTLLGARVYKEFDATENGVSLGRYMTSEGKTDFVPMSRLTLGTSVTATDPVEQLATFRTGTGAPNVYPKVGPLVISEIMYHPVDTVPDPNGIGFLDNNQDEYVEIFNPSGQTVTLYDNRGPYSGLYYDPNYPQYGFYADGRTNTWRVRGDIDFNFPTNVSLRAGECLLVVNFDPTTNLTQLSAFKTKFKVPAGVQLFGPYGGKLPNGSGTVELQKPDPPQGPAHPDFREVPHIFVERAKYSDGAPWPLEADGLGKALARVSFTGYANDPTNWVASAPSPGRLIQDISFSSITRSGSSLILRFDAVAGSSFTLQYRDALTTGAAWAKLTDIVAANTGRQEATVSLSTGTRFYRLVSPMQP